MLSAKKVLGVLLLIVIVGSAFLGGEKGLIQGFLC